MDVIKVFVGLAIGLFIGRMLSHLDKAALSHKDHCIYEDHKVSEEVKTANDTKYLMRNDILINGKSITEAGIPLPDFMREDNLLNPKFTEPPPLQCKDDDDSEVHRV